MFRSTHTPACHAPRSPTCVCVCDCVWLWAGGRRCGRVHAHVCVVCIIVCACVRAHACVRACAGMAAPRCTPPRGCMLRAAATHSGDARPCLCGRHALTAGVRRAQHPPMGGAVDGADAVWLGEPGQGLEGAQPACGHGSHAARGGCLLAALACPGSQHALSTVNMRMATPMQHNPNPGVERKPMLPHQPHLRMRSAWSHGLKMSLLVGGPCWSGVSEAGDSLRLPSVAKAALILSTALITSSVSTRV